MSIINKCGDEMTIINLKENIVLESEIFPLEMADCKELFVMCNVEELVQFDDVFKLEKSTVIDCADLDETVRYTNFDGYDFVSLIHMETITRNVILREINIYISKHYLFIVIPEHNSPRLAEFEKALISAAKSLVGKPHTVNRLYFFTFHSLLADFSDMLEQLEDDIESLSEVITTCVDTSCFSKINDLRRLTFTAKKQLRALSYLGEELLVDENNIIDKMQTRYFRNIDTRLKKLYDFAASLYDLSGQLLYSYDSKVSSKTNDIMTKLTLITTFFAPLTLIAGIYGMNFVHMPELRMRYAYPVVLIVMAAISLAIYLYLRKKRLL